MNTSLRQTGSTKISISLADEEDREVIYRMRHEVYARELRQHHENNEGRLIDKLDTVNVYIVAKAGEEIAGFISITPPNEIGYSIDKYFKRKELPFTFDERLYEARILTVSQNWRSSRIAALLMYATLRYIQSRGGKTIVGIGRLDILDMYKHAGFYSLQKQIHSGQVTFELMAANVEDDRSPFVNVIANLEKHTEWNLDGIGFHSWNVENLESDLV